MSTSQAEMGASLNPQSSYTGIRNNAMFHATMNAALTFIPSCMAVKYWMTKPGFVARTNASSRTAIAIMPAVFCWALSAELGVIQGRRDDGNRNALVQRHGTQSPATQSPAAANAAGSNGKLPPPPKLDILPASQLYKAETGDNVRIVPKLSLFMNMSNFLMDYPFRIMCGLGAPLVGTIFYWQMGQKHITTAQKVMHTRVIGQFSVLSILLSLMAWKSHMDNSGRFVSEEEATEMLADEHYRKLEMLAYLDKQQQMADRRKEMKAKRAAAQMALTVGTESKL